MISLANDAALNSVSIASGDAGEKGDSVGLLNLLKASGRKFTIGVATPDKMDVCKVGECGDLSSLKGFYYRVPRPTEVRFKAFTETVTTDKDKTPKTIESEVTGPIREKRLIAQHGVLAALNSRFKGQGGKVNLKVWPDSGGIQSVEIGSTALPTAVVTGQIDGAFQQYKAKKDAAAAASAVDTELEQLKAEEAKKALKKKIREYDKALTED